MEQLILDPTDLAPDRVQLDLNTGAIRVRDEGPDWGEASIQAYMAEAVRGQVPVDYRLPNREVKIPLQAHSVTGTTLAQARANLQAKVAEIQRRRGFLKRVLTNGAVLYLDVVNATAKFGGGSMQARGLADNEIDLTLECVPDFYGEEEAGDPITGTGEIAEVLQKDGADWIIKGNFPGRLRLEIDETSGNDQLGVIAALRYHDLDATAALVYEAEDLSPLGDAVVATLSGASGGEVVQHTALTTEWITVLGTALGETDHLTHEGTFRAWARVHPHGGNVSLRLLSDVGDLTLPKENAAVAPPATDDFYLVDLGEVRLDAAPVGTHRWQGLVQAKGVEAGEDVSIDKVYLVPVPAEQGYATLRAVEV